MSTLHVRVDSEVKNALAEHTENTGKRINVCASLAITEWLQKQGVVIEYPRIKTKQPKTAA